jgi:hypothetical protein
MGTSLNALVASERIADLHRAAHEAGAGAGRAGLRLRLRRWRRSGTAAVNTPRPAVAVRFADPDEAGTLRHLAELDDAPELAGEVLIATIDAHVVAALALDDGRVVANPFVLTADAVALLRRTATELSRRPRRRWRSTLSPRLA